MAFYLCWVGWFFASICWLVDICRVMMLIGGYWTRVWKSIAMVSSAFLSVFG